MTTDRPQPPVAARARRILTEGLVIVTSILIAFSIDAWWDGRQEDRARRALLLALRQDAGEIRAESEVVRMGLNDSFEARRAFLALEEDPGLTEADAVRVDSIVSTQFRAPPFDAPLGAAQALISGTDLSTVESEELVGAVTRLVSLVGNLERNQGKLHGIGFATAKRCAEEGARLFISDIHERLAELGVDMTHMGLGSERELLARPRPTEAWRHVQDPRLRSLAWFGWHFTFNVVSNLDAIEAELTIIEKVVDERVPR